MTATTSWIGGHTQCVWTWLFRAVVLLCMAGVCGGALALTATTTTLTSATNPVTIGASSLLSATVSPALASGTVTLKDGTTTLGTATLSQGVATFDAPFTLSGSRSLSAVYAGNATYATSTSPTVTQTVTMVSGNWGLIGAQNAAFSVASAQVVRFGAGPAWVQKVFSGAGTCSTTFFGSDPSPGVIKQCEVLASGVTSVALASSVNPVAVSGSTVLTATVTPSAAVGSVTFRDGTTALATVAVSAGVASSTRSFTTAGTHSLTAVFSGNATYAGNTSTALAQTVNPRATTTTLSSSVNPSVTSQVTTLRATLSPSTATGSVTFMDGSTTLGTVNVAAGVSTLNSGFSSAGAHSLTAVYSGDANHLTSTSAALTQTVSTPGSLPAPLIAAAPDIGLEYDAKGNVTKTIQAPGVVGFGFATQNSYDVLDRVKNITDAKLGLTRFAYDGLGRNTQVTDPRNLVTQSPRNGLGDVTQLSSPDTGTANLTYDAGGNLLTRTDSRGAFSTYRYDALNRLTGIVHSQSGQTSLSYAWIFDQTGAGFSNGVGRLTSTLYPTGSGQFSYDAQGRLLTQVQRVNPGTGANSAQITSTVMYGYDSAGNVTSVTYPSGRVVRISYTGGQPSAVTLAKDSASAAAPLISQVQFSPFGGVLSWKWALNTGAESHDHVFDTSGRLVRYRLGRHVRDVGYDAADRIAAYTHYDAGSGAATAAATALDQRFGYDELGRLVTVSANAASWSIGYDANGNRTSVTLSGAARIYTTAATSNRLTSISAPVRNFGYDNAGNTTSDSASYSSTYNLAGRLATLTKGTITTTFSHDGMGRRVRKFSSNGATTTTIFVHDQAGHLLGEYSNTGAAIREYVWLGDTPVAMFTPSAVANNPPVAYFIHADHLQTPRVVVDQNNAVRWTWMSEPFGTAAPNANPQGLGSLAFNLRFPGQFADSETGLSHNMFRDYDSTIGRYVQSDPIGLAGGINTYAYVEGNPVSLVDPLGLATYMCTQPLHALGAAGLTVYSPSSNPLYHQFIGIIRPDGSVMTGGQDRAGGPWSLGKPSDGDGAPGSGAECKKVEDDNECIEQCLIDKFAAPRPKYSLALQSFTGGQNCQGWSDTTLAQCQASCKAKR